MRPADGVDLTELPQNKQPSQKPRNQHQHNQEFVAKFLKLLALAKLMLAKKYPCEGRHDWRCDGFNHENIVYEKTSRIRRLMPNCTFLGLGRA